MRVEIHMPDTAAFKNMREALLADERIVVIEGFPAVADVRLIHARLLPRGASALRDLASADGSIVVTSAPRDPEILAGYLISGVSGYHISGESWAQLLNVIREVYAGRYRFDPYVISHVLEHYRQLRKHSQRGNGFGRYLH
jgi:DNA-binding NarL/FixJ family response regulator